jgi:hypothetical protein
MTTSLFIYLVLVGIASLQVSAIDKFRAAVYEHKVIYPGSRSKVVTRQQALIDMQKNLQIYQEQSMTASSKVKEQLMSNLLTGSMPNQSTLSI